MKNKVAVRFGTAFSGMFYERISDPEIFAPLNAVNAYEEANIAIRNVEDSLMKELSEKQTKSLQALFAAFWAVKDFESQYFYRMGVQDGIVMQNGTFLTEGL